VAEGAKIRRGEANGTRLRLRKRRRPLAAGATGRRQHTRDDQATPNTMRQGRIRHVNDSPFPMYTTFGPQNLYEPLSKSALAYSLVFPANA